MVWASYVTEPDVRRGSEVYLIGAPLIINLNHPLPPPLPHRRSELRAVASRDFPAPAGVWRCTWSHLGSTDRPVMLPTSVSHPEAVGNQAMLPDKSALVPSPVGSLTLEPLPEVGPIPLSVIVPTFNESKNIADLVVELSEALSASHARGTFEIIVVDDDSPDRTWEVALGLTAQYPWLRVVRREQERGLSTAVIRGWQVARGEVLAVIDGDLQHPPDVIPRLFEKLRGGADLAVGSRNTVGGGVSDWSMWRRMLSRGAQLLGLLILPGVLGRVSDPMSGCFAIKRRVIEGVTLNPLGYKILLEVIARGNVGKVSEVGYVFRERTVGASKVTARIYVEYIGHLIRLRLATLPIARFVRFCVVGLTGVAVDMGLLYLLSDPSQLGLGLTRSKAIAAEVAIINNFLWNDLWTFRKVARVQGAGVQRFRRFLSFNAICGVGLVLNLIILNTLFNGFGMNRYVANGIAIGAVTLWNFWLNSRISWNLGPEQRDE